jgi:CRISPR/Cas system-associated endonuclease Cas3-HD
MEESSTEVVGDGMEVINDKKEMSEVKDEKKNLPEIVEKTAIFQNSILGPMDLSTARNKKIAEQEASRLALIELQKTVINEDGENHS